MEYSLIFFWAACVALACAGFGKEVLRWMRCREAGWSVASVLGVSILIAVGGILNLAHAIRLPVLITVILIGFLLLVRALVTERQSLRASLPSLSSVRPKPRWMAVAGLLVLVLIGGRAALSSYTCNFNETDDFNAYLAFPLKMLATGNFAADPFSERRMMSSLGGSVYLQALILSVEDHSLDHGLRAINLPDGTLGLLLFAAVCATLCRLAQLNPNRAFWVFLVFALTPDYRINSTSVVLPAALTLGGLLILTTPAFGSHLSSRRYFALGLTMAAACTLKSTVIPTIALICCTLLVIELFNSPIAQVLRAAAVLSATALGVLAPWMIDSKIKTGTALYPILGRGYHFTAHSSLPPLPASALLPLALKTAVVSAPYLWTAIFILLRPGKFLGAYRTATLAVLLGTGLGNIALSYATVGDSVIRYSITTAWPANIFLVMVFLAVFSPKPQGDSPVFILPIQKVWVVWALVFALLAANAWKVAFTGAFHRKPLWAPGEREQAKELQAAIPVGAPLLTHTTHAYTADFRRNPILMADYPGMASLPPGMPVGEGPEPLAQYLLQHSIRYVAYSYYDQAGFTHAYYDDKVRSWTGRPWAREQLIAALNFQDNIAELAQTRRHLFDDGRVYVLDLMDRTAAPARMGREKLPGGI